MTYKTTTNLKEFDLTGMDLESVKELSEFWGFNLEYAHWNGNSTRMQKLKEGNTLVIKLVHFKGSNISIKDWFWRKP